MTFRASYYESLKFDKVLEVLLVEDNVKVRVSIAQGFHEVTYSQLK